MDITPNNIKKTHQEVKSLTKKSKEGYEFDIYSDRWLISRTKNIHFTNALKTIPAKKLNYLRLALAYYAEFKSASHTQNSIENLKLYLRNTGESDVGGIKLINWRANHLTEATEYKLGMLRGFLIHAYDSGYKIINRDDVDVLEQLTLKGNPSGVAVRKGCPYSGALDHIEQQAFSTWLVNAFSDKQIGLREFSFILALQFTGRRPIQIASLTFGDLERTKRADGTTKYSLRVPRAKQRHASFRETFKKIPIHENLYFSLLNQAKGSIELFETQIKCSLSDSFKSKLPIFPIQSKVLDLKDKEDLIQKLKEPASYLFEINASQIYQPALNQCDVSSARISGEVIDLNARRFRYTYATNLRNKGAGAHTLAEALDHSNTNNVLVYTQMTGEFVDTLTEKMATAMAPLSQAFQGTLVDDEREAFRRQDTRSLIKSSNAEDIGNCGTQAYCQSGFLSCYTCRHFHPWLNAPHKEVLNYLEEKRQKQKEWGVSEFVISSTDTTYLAVKQVINMCKKIKLEKELTDTVVSSMKTEVENV